MTKELVLVWNEEIGELVKIKNMDQFNAVELMDLKDDFSHEVEKAYKEWVLSCS